MKTLVGLLIIILLFACAKKQQEVTKETPVEPVVEIAPTPEFTVEERAGKYGLLQKGAIISSFDYDSIIVSELYPILIKGKGKYIFFNLKIFGPYTEVSILKKGLIKIVTYDRLKSGFIEGDDYNNYNVRLFDYPDVEQETKHSSLYWVTDKSGKRGLISTNFAVSTERLVLPLGHYLYTYIKVGSGGYSGHGHEGILIYYYTQNKIGEITVGAHYHGLGGKYTNEIKEIKVTDLFGPAAKILSVSSAKTAIVKSKKGYGLINLSGDILVPASYFNYEVSGDSAYLFSSNMETLRVNLNGAKI